VSNYQVCALCTGQFEGTPVRETDEGRTLIFCSQKHRDLYWKRENAKEAARYARRLGERMKRLATPEETAAWDAAHPDPE
jgi:hypothetical protein